MTVPSKHPRAFAAVALVIGLAGAARAETPGAPPPVAEAQSGSVPSLARVISLAKTNAPSVAVARAEVGIGKAEYAGARLSPLTNPYLEIQAQRGTQGQTKDVALQGQLSIPVEISGQRGRRVAEVDALVAWREANVDAARAAAAGEAVRAYGSVAVALARVHAFEAIAAGTRAEAEVYEARLAARDATEQDAKLAQVELARVTVTLAEARADLTRALMDLNRRTGARFSEARDLDPEPPAPGKAAQAAARSPAVKVLEQEAAYHARARDRQAREAHSPLYLILTAGRGDFGEARFGGGIGWYLPLLRAGQGEQARAEAERARASVEREVTARALATMLEGLAAEREMVRRAIAELGAVGEPAAKAAVDAAVAMQRAGKAELLHVLTARRDFALLKTRRLDLLLREWSIVSEIVALTGELP
jgi:cobalt-zinc-cadmium efflux system outer membrane protein